MKKIILCTVLTLVSLQPRLFAQGEDKAWLDKIGKMSKTERTFSVISNNVNIRDFAHLKSGRVIFELDNVEDYNLLKNLDSLLSVFERDIRFYKDSLLNIAGSVRIDYVVSSDHEYKEIRFRKNPPEGDIFVSKYGDVSRLKIEDDTVRILMHVKGKEVDTYGRIKGGKKGHIMWAPQRTIAVTFCLNNYSDIEKVIAERAMLYHAIDTLQSTKMKGTINDPVKFPSSTIFAPYSTNTAFRFDRRNGLMDNESTPYSRMIKRSDNLTAGINVGAGLVRNTLTPMAEFSLSFFNRRGFNSKDYNTLANLSVSPYFFFDRAANGDYKVYDNWFVNFDIGGTSDGIVKSKLLTGGVGYLFSAKGNYFKGTTMKAYFNIALKNGFTISPEVIFTNDFKQVFPGITLKIF